MVQTDVAPTPRSLKEKQREEREALILQAAEDVLMEKGYHEACIDEIASRVGIAKGTVYLHFPSKEDLIVALFARNVRQLLAQVDRIVDAQGTAYTRLEAVLGCVYGTLFLKRMQLLYAIYNGVEPQRQCPPRGESVRGLWERLATRVRSLLEVGKAAGEFDQTIPTSVMLCTFFSLLSSKSYERLIVEEKMTGDELAQYFGRIYFKGIRNI
jgi:TetR/AcrR family transcriptional regulator, fatty acid metabolism regulator protein